MVPTWSVTGDVKRYQMVMKCLPASSTVKLLFCPFLLYSLEASIKSGLSWEEGNNLSSWRGLCLRILLGFSVRKTGLFCPVYLFVFIELCSFICVDSCLFILYFELQSHTRSCILLLRSVRLGPWRGAGEMLFSTSLWHALILLSLHHSLSGTTRCSRPFCFLCSSCRIGHFSKELWFLLVLPTF